jgi:competence ComEA-like helix-hairpin-helix protein
MLYLRRTERIVIGVLALGAIIGMAVFAYSHYRPPVTPFVIRPSSTIPLSPGIKGATPLARAPLPVPVNTATVDELMRLDGIGRKIAERIVRYREEHGRFVTKSDLKNVDGIGEKLFGTIKEKVIID